ncbi:MAG: hypothetical protein E4H02_05190 [Lentisphaerales bacterium]|jgi:carboxyl-terminal processing protease|nr:MAG: hypothetical protein E4H02_05190 [Lentisphaerales bacterium]
MRRNPRYKQTTVLLRLARHSWAVAGLVLAVALVVFSPVSAEQLPLQPEPIHGEIARVFSEKLPALHLRAVSIDDTMAAKALLLYLTALDPEHDVFLSDDVVGFRQTERELDNLLKQGGVEPAFEILAVFKIRLRDRCEFVDRLLADGFDVTAPDWIERREVTSRTPWPADELSRDELWRKKIKNEYLRRVILAKTDTPDEEDAEPEDAGAEMTEISGKYRQILTFVEDNDAEWVVEQYLSAFARSFDPHSDYMSARETEDFDISMRLSLVGIGAVLTSEDGFAKIVSVIPGGPAERDGRLQPGDRIVAVGEGDGDPVDVMHWPLSKTVEIIRGKKGSTVVLMIVPATAVSGAASVKVDIMRDDVKLEEQAVKGETREILTGTDEGVRLGVITIPGFYVDMARTFSSGKNYTSSARDVAEVLKGMSRDNVDGVLLDLRGNGGGSLEEAVKMTGLFIDRGPVVQMKDRRRIMVLEDEESGTAYSGPLVVLITRMSASASEILAASLQDYGRAIIVGDSRTHGKGTVQSIVPLKTRRGKRGSLKVTTASFFRINGSSTQVKGVAADIVVSSPLDSLSLGEDAIEYALPWSRIEPLDLERPVGSSLLEDLLLGRFLGGTGNRGERVKDISPMINELKIRSQERRHGNPKFVAREGLLSRYSEREKLDRISLNLDERMKLAMEERRLYELQLAEADIIGDNNNGGRKGRSGDLVLEEALSILADAVAYEARTARAREDD